jgi:hypothetical protein
MSSPREAPEQKDLIEPVQDWGRNAARTASITPSRATYTTARSGKRANASLPRSEARTISVSRKSVAENAPPGRASARRRRRQGRMPNLRGERPIPRRRAGAAASGSRRPVSRSPSPRRALATRLTRTRCPSSQCAIAFSSPPICVRQRPRIWWPGRCVADALSAAAVRVALGDQRRDPQPPRNRRASQKPLGYLNDSPSLAFIDRQ